MSQSGLRGEGTIMRNGIEGLNIVFLKNYKKKCCSVTIWPGTITLKQCPYCQMLYEL